MKKKLEAELISIAHRILKIKNKSDIDQLHHEAGLLYEKLSVLRFVEANFSEVKPTIGRAEAQEILETAFDNPPEVETETPEPAAEPKPQPDVINKENVEAEPDQPEAADVVHDIPEETDQPTAQEEPEPVSEPAAEEQNDVAVEPAEENTEAPSAQGQPEEAAAELVQEQEAAAEPTAERTEEQTSEPEAEMPAPADEELFKPAFEWAFDPKEEQKTETPNQEKPIGGQIAFDELLGKGYTDPVFVKPEDLEREKQGASPDIFKDPIPITRTADKVPVFKMNNEIADKTISLNDRLSKGITVGLNDRIAFVKHLFGNSNEDYNRVLSQLITFDTFAEAQDFIDNMVKPDYNNWDGKDEYAQRFMEVVEKKFT